MVTPETELWDPQQASKHKQFNFNLTTYLSSSFILTRLHSGFTHFLTLNKHNTILLWTILLIVFISQIRFLLVKIIMGKRRKDQLLLNLSVMFFSFFSSTTCFEPLVLPSERDTSLCPLFDASQRSRNQLPLRIFEISQLTWQLCSFMQ